MNIIRFIAAITVTSAMACTTAAAQSDLRGETFCFPAKKVPKLVKKLSKVDESRRDVVDVGLMPKFLIKDGGVWPEKFFIRTKSKDIDIPVKKPSGETPTFLEIAKKHPYGDVCIKDKTRAALPATDEGLYFEMGLSPLFHNTSGEHDLDELREGTKDGKKFYKKMIPGPLSVVLPDTKYLAVRYDDFRGEAEIYARVEDREIKLTPETLKDKHIVALDTLENMKANALIIKGGPYQLQPTVSAALMKRFGWGEDADKDEG